MSDTVTEEAQTGIEANKRLVEAFHRDFSTGDVPKILSYFDEDGSWWVAGDGSMALSGTYDLDGMRELFEGVGAQVKSGIKLTALAMTAEGERVACESMAYAEVTNGNVYDNRYHFLFIIRNGKIHQVKEYLDTIHTPRLSGSQAAA